MNVFQTAQQLVWALNQDNFKWPTVGAEGVQEPVLSRVVVGPQAPDFFHQDFAAPAAILHVERGQDDREHPADVVDEQRFTLYLFTSNPSETSGSAAVVGGNRQDLGSSRGRGLLEIEPLVKSQIFNMTGLRARPVTVGGNPTDSAGRMQGAIAERALEIVVRRLPSFPDYGPIQRLKASGGAGSVALTWAAPPNRYDLVGYTVVRKAGATAPTTPADGTATFVAGTAASFAGGVTYNDAPGAGTWSYSVFWAYDSTTDPFTGVNGSPPGTPNPNAWSSSQSSQSGLAYLPASVTITV